MKKFKKTLACSVFALAQLGAVTIPMSLITTQQTCAMSPAVKAALKKVAPVVKEYVKFTLLDKAAEKAGNSLSEFFDEVKKLLAAAGAKSSAAYQQVIKMEAEDATFFSDYEFASDLP